MFKIGRVIDALDSFKFPCILGNFCYIYFAIIWHRVLHLILMRNTFNQNIFSFTENSLNSQFNLERFSRRVLSQVNLMNQFILYLNYTTVS